MRICDTYSSRLVGRLIRSNWFNRAERVFLAEGTACERALRQVAESFGGTERLFTK